MVVPGWDKHQRIQNNDQKHLGTSGNWQLAWSDEDLSQSALTEAHGDCAGGEISPWEAQIGKWRSF